MFLPLFHQESCLNCPNSGTRVNRRRCISGFNHPPSAGASIGSRAASTTMDCGKDFPITNIPLSSVLETDDVSLLRVVTHATGPAGVLPLTAEMLLTQPSGNLFGLSQNAGMGWDPTRLLDPEFLILSTHGGLRAQDGTPIALGFHTGHWEVGLLVAGVARELRNLHAIPFAGACTDPCDGRTQGTDGMLA